MPTVLRYSWFHLQIRRNIKLNWHTLMNSVHHFDIVKWLCLTKHNIPRPRFSQQCWWIHKWRWKQKNPPHFETSFFVTIFPWQSILFSETEKKNIQFCRVKLEHYIIFIMARRNSCGFFVCKTWERKQFEGGDEKYYTTKNILRRRRKIKSDKVCKWEWQK